MCNFNGMEKKMTNTNNTCISLKYELKYNMLLNVF